MLVIRFRPLNSQVSGPCVGVTLGVGELVGVCVVVGDGAALRVAVAVIVAVAVAVSVAVAGAVGGGATQFEPSQNEWAKKMLPAVQSAW